MDDIEGAAIAAEGLDPDDTGVVAALARVSTVLAEPGGRRGVRLPSADREKRLQGTISIILTLRQPPGPSTAIPGRIPEGGHGCPAAT